MRRIIWTYLVMVPVPDIIQQTPNYILVAIH